MRRSGLVGSVAFVPNRVFVDANVLSSRTLRGWLFMTRNAVPGMFELYSSLDVVAESVRAVRRSHRKSVATSQPAMRSSLSGT